MQGFIDLAPPCTWNFLGIAVQSGHVVRVHLYNLSYALASQSYPHLRKCYGMLPPEYDAVNGRVFNIGRREEMLRLIALPFIKDLSRPLLRLPIEPLERLLAYTQQ